MRIIYLANIRFPTEKAHGIQIAKACEAFQKAGHQVELVVPSRRTPIAEPWQEYYGIRTPFTVTRLKVPDTVSWGKLGFLFETFFFALSAARYARRANADLVYCRDEHVVALALRLGVANVIWESHDGVWNGSARYAAKRVKKMVVVTEGQRAFYVAEGIEKEKILAVPNGVDLEAFKNSESKAAARMRLGLPPNARIALYVGAFGSWKGTETLFQAAEILGSAVVVVAIGGTPEQVAEQKALYPCVVFLGERPYRELHHNLAAADVCVLPNTGGDPISVSFTSPLKLLAYMAAEKPIVASDLPSTRELVSDEAAVMVRPDDPRALSEGIMQMLSNPEVALHRAHRARMLVEKFSWDARAEKVLAHIVSSRFI